MCTPAVCVTRFVGKLFKVSSRTVARYVDLFQQTGDVVPRPSHHGPYPLLGSYDKLILVFTSWIFRVS